MPRHEFEVFALAAGPVMPLGRFLMNLPAVLAYRAIGGRIFCGAPLNPRQAEILATCSLLDDYLPLSAPARFASVRIAQPGHRFGSYMARLADAVRGPAFRSGESFAILPARATEPFCLANRASLTAWLRAKRVTLMDPETMSFADLAGRLAGAAMLLLGDATQAGLLSLCQPGTKLVEMAPDGWLDAQGRDIAARFGLAWEPFVATPPSYPLLAQLAFGSRVPMSYEVPIRELGKLLERIAGAPV